MLFHHSYRAVGAHLQIAATVYLAGVAEAAFLHHAPRSGIVDKEIAPYPVELLDVETIVHHQTQSLCADALVPIWACHPIARLHVVLANVNIALAVGVIADAPYKQHLVLIGDSFRVSMLPYLEKDFSILTAVQRENMRDVSEEIKNSNIIVVTAVERFDTKMFDSLEELKGILTE